MCCIDAHALVDASYEAVLLDLDNTLYARGASGLAAPELAWLDSLRDAGLKLAIVSNSTKQRVIDTGEELDVPVVVNALKPFTRGYREAAELLGVELGRCLMVGDQTYTDILGAHFAGIDAVLVVPMNRKDPVHTRILRLLDAAAVLGMKPEALANGQDA